MSCSCGPAPPGFCATVQPSSPVIVMRRSRGVSAFITMLDGRQLPLEDALNAYNCPCTSGVTLACSVVNGLMRVVLSDRTDALPFGVPMTLLALNALLIALAPPTPAKPSVCP